MNDKLMKATVWLIIAIGAMVLIASVWAKWFRKEGRYDTDNI